MRLLEVRKILFDEEALFDGSLRARELGEVWNPQVPLFEERLKGTFGSLYQKVFAHYEHFRLPMSSSVLSRLFLKRTGKGGFESFSDFLEALCLSQTLPLYHSRTKTGALLLLPAVVVETIASRELRSIEVTPLSDLLAGKPGPVLTPHGVRKAFPPSHFVLPPGWWKEDSLPSPALSPVRDEVTDSVTSSESSTPLFLESSQGVESDPSDPV